MGRGDSERVRGVRREGSWRCRMREKRVTSEGKEDGEEWWSEDKRKGKVVRGKIRSEK